MSALITISILAIVVLYLGLFKAEKFLLPVTVGGLLLALGFAVVEWDINSAPIYSGMMLYDNFAVAFSALAIVSTILILLLSGGYFEKISTHVSECYTLVLFTLAGIIVMVSYHNLAMLFVGIEIMSVSLYILAGIRKNDFGSNEAALKYFLMGAFSTGFLLFGITLIYGATGSFDLAAIKQYVEAVQTGQVISPLFYGGIILLIVGMCFKIGAAPFHFWTPDVYQGSPTLITAFMGTVVKTAGFAAFLRLFSYSFGSVHDFWMPVLVAIAILTLLIGNITALYQNSFKRMLSYSSISHAGYMLFGLIALQASSAGSVFLYAFAYSLASIVAFAVLILLQDQTDAESFDGFNGLARKNPFLAFTLTVAMLSLAGIPLTAGFIGKFMMFSGVLSEQHIWLVIIAVLNAIIAIGYYLKVIISVYFNDTDRPEVNVPFSYKIVLGVSALAMVVLGVYPAFLPSIF
jgi:NADH-quinone oxidoreductase subunit N